MKIIVAGAGAGKTTSMAVEVIDRYHQLTDNKIIYVITYTNASKENIRNKLIEELGTMPKNIKVETSHAFLLHELIFPYHRLLYGAHYTNVSLFELPTNFHHKLRILKELHSQNIIHVGEVSRVAKHVAVGKAKDKVNIQKKRENILCILSEYLDSIFMDEAQDMDEHLATIIEKLDQVGLYIHLVGDPKQDLRGYHQFRGLIRKNKKSVIYLNQNYRCPNSHIILANQYTPLEEKQDLSNKDKGTIHILFESKIDLNKVLNDSKWTYKFIYKKNSHYQTNKIHKNKSLEALRYELKLVCQKSPVKKFSLNQKVFVLENWILNKINSMNNQKIIDYMSRSLGFKFGREEWRRLNAVIDLNRLEDEDEGYLVHSIDKVKGLEGKNCLFILTTGLTDYLFKIKNERNKMMNYVYVALTRSTKNLTLLITNEVEEKYGFEFISNWFSYLK